MFKTFGKFLGLSRSDREGEAAIIDAAESYTIRFGKSVPTDDVFDAWTSGSLPAMLRVLDRPTNLIDRHHLLQAIVKETYRKRETPKHRQQCIDVAELHLSELPQIVPALKKDMGDMLPRISTFQHYATVLTEDGDYDRAIEVCEQAIGYGLSDGTKSDYAGRINRIRKKQS